LIYDAKFFDSQGFVMVYNKIRYNVCFVKYQRSNFSLAYFSGMLILNRNRETWRAIRWCVKILECPVVNATVARAM